MSRSVASKVIWLATLLQTPVACSDATEPEPPVAAEFRMIRGSGQEGTVGSILGDTLVGRVLDQHGRGLPNQDVDVRILAGGGSVAPAPLRTDSLGYVRAVWTLGTTAGEHLLEMQVGALPPMVFRAVATAADPAVLALSDGDLQQSAPGMPLPKPLAVRVTDVYGNPAGGAVVEWLVVLGSGSISPASASADSSGLAQATWTLGPHGGENRVRAQMGSTSVVFSAVGRTAAGPVVREISPDLLRPGITVTVRGENLASASSATVVAIAGVQATVTEATPGELTLTLPPVTAFPCLPVREVPVLVTVPDAGDWSQMHPLSVAVRRELSPGEHLLLSDAAELSCNELPAGTGMHLIAVINTSPTPAGLAPFQLRGAVLGPTSSSTPLVASTRQSAGKRGGPDRYGRTWDQIALHLRLLEETQRLLRKHVSAGQVATSSRRPSGNRLAGRAPNPSDTVTFRIGIGPDWCRDFREVRARAVYVGEHAVVFEDVANPLAGQMDETFLHLGRTFDEVQFGILSRNFGDPLALDRILDANGRLHMLFSRVLVEMGAGGFVAGVDMIPRAQCPSSNEADVFYGNVAMAPEDLDYWMRWAMGMVMHEAKHIVSAGARLSQQAVPEESWLEEATAEVAVELFGRAAHKYERFGNVGYQDMRCEFEWADAACTGKPNWMWHKFHGMYDFYQRVSVSSPVGSCTPGDGTYYNSGWSLVRWAADHAQLAESDFLRALVQERSLSGVANLEARVGRGFAELVPDWALALALDDHPDFSGSASHPSMNFRDIFAGLNGRHTGAFPLPFPLKVWKGEYGNFQSEPIPLCGGAAAFFEITAGLDGHQAVRLTGAGGGAPSSFLKMAIVRSR